MATEKFKALVHFIIHECREHPGKLGAIRLNKALWYTDVVGYEINGVSVTGETYVKRRKGPVPSHILAILREMMDEGKILIQEPKHQYNPRNFISLESPDHGILSDDEKEMARSILGSVCGYTANEISELTDDAIWDAAVEGEDIPIRATLAARAGEITDEILQWANNSIAARQAA